MQLVQNQAALTKTLFNDEVLIMMRMLLEIIMALGLVGCLYFVTQVLAKENKQNGQNEEEKK